MKASPRSQ